MIPPTVGRVRVLAVPDDLEMSCANAVSKSPGRYTCVPEGRPLGRPLPCPPCARSLAVVTPDSPGRCGVATARRGAPTWTTESKNFSLVARCYRLNAYRARRAIHPMGRKRASLMKYAFQIIGMLGAALVGVGGNIVYDDNPTKATIGLWMLIVGVMFGAGGFASFTYLFVRDYRGEMKVVIRGANLFVTQDSPLTYAWTLVVEVVITPPDGRNVLLISDNIRARIDGLIEHPFPLEISNLGISPSTNARIADGAYTELTVTREIGAVCDGVTGLQTNVAATFPDRLVYDLELMDATGDWFTVVASDLHRVPDLDGFVARYGGFPDIEKPMPERFEDKLVRWAPFAVMAAIFVSVCGWMAWSILVKGTW